MLVTLIFTAISSCHTVGCGLVTRATPDKCSSRRTRHSSVASLASSPRGAPVCALEVEPHRQQSAGRQSGLRRGEDADTRRAAGLLARVSLSDRAKLHVRARTEPVSGKILRA